MEFKPLNLAQLYQGADQAVASAMQMNLMALQASRMKQEFDEEDSLRSLARTHTVTNPETGAVGMDLKSFTKAAYGVNPMKAMGFEKAAAEADKTALERENLQGQVDERRMKVAADKLKFMNEASSVPFLKYKELVEKGVPDAEARKQVQPHYVGAIRNLVSSGLFTEAQIGKFDLRPEFDPTHAEAGMRQVLGAKDSLADYWKQRDFGETTRHNKVTEGETGRHNLATEGQAQASLTQAQQHHLDTLSNQGNEIKQNDDGTWVVINKNTRTSQPVRDPGTGQLLQGNKPLTESQAKALGFGQRAVNAHNLLISVDEEIGKAVSMKQSAGNTPLVGGVLEAAINKASPDGMQKYEQAQNDFITAILRPESGATITKEETEAARKRYFPQVGDGAAVIKQKKESREREIEALKSMAGPQGAKQFPAIAAPKAEKPPAGAKAPPVGEVQDGYKFKGGDPWKPESWEKV